MDDENQDKLLRKAAYIEGFIEGLLVQSNVTRTDTDLDELRAIMFSPFLELAHVYELLSESDSSWLEVAKQLDAWWAKHIGHPNSEEVANKVLTYETSAARREYKTLTKAVGK